MVRMLTDAPEARVRFPGLAMIHLPICLSCSRNIVSRNDRLITQAYMHTGIHAYRHLHSTHTTMRAYTSIYSRTYLIFIFLLNPKNQQF